MTDLEKLAFETLELINLGDERLSKYEVNINFPLLLRALQRVREEALEGAAKMIEAMSADEYNPVYLAEKIRKLKEKKNV